jgi:metal-responsive CopG/Arc/MetJ family transcriptional regulator
MSKPQTKRILVHIPTNFLQEFDKKISGIYASRSEAVRAGMIIVIENEKKQQHQKQQKISALN